MKPVYYIRHNTLEGKIVENLFKEKRIGVRFANIGKKGDKDRKEKAFNPNEYPEDKDGDYPDYKKSSAQNAIKGLNNCMKDQAIVVASYEKKDEIHIGIAGQSDVYDEVGMEVKYVQLIETISISIRDFPMPFLAAPPFMTICQWHIGKKAINEFYNARLKAKKTNTRPNITPGIFSSSQLEALCEEWMREKGFFKRKLFKSGGSMKDFDMFGLNEKDEYVVGQVKYECAVEDIKSFIDSEFVNKYLFTTDKCIESIRNSIGKTKIFIHSIEDVMSDFDKDYLLKLAFGINLKQFDKNP